MNELPIRPYERDDSVHIVISFERDINMKNVERTVYGFLDMLGDIGGVAQALIAIGTLTLAILQYQVFENYLV